MDFFYEDDHRPTSPIHPIEAVKKLLVKTGDLGGRASRSEFWNSFWFYFLVGPLLFATDIFYRIAILSISSFVGVGLLDTLLFDPLSYFVILLELALFYSFTSVTVRRLHDSGRTGWWLITTPIPLLNFCIALLPHTRRRI